MPEIIFVEAFSSKMLYKCAVAASYSSSIDALYNRLNRFNKGGSAKSQRAACRCRGSQPIDGGPRVFSHFGRFGYFARSVPRALSGSSKGMQQKNTAAIPAYQRIQGTIRKRIEAGHLRPGDAVDSERDLAKIHQVSLMTARHALAGLEREGIVERRRGIGTFVAAPKIHFNKLMSYTEQMASRSLTAASRVLTAKIVDDEQEVIARLNLPPMTSLIKIERLRHAAQEPFALETCYLPAEQFPRLLSATLGRESLFGLLEREYKVEIGYADEEVDATAADPRTADLLGVIRKDPVLRIRQIIYSSKGKPMMYVLGFYRSDRHNLVIRRFR
jgi:GntR family transcriptional regulator